MTRLSATIRPCPVTGDWVSHCPEWNIYSQGRTREAAIASLQDALILVSRYAKSRNLALGGLN